ncbi:DNA repair protein RAD57 [Biscogniauxia mediterranea]|nr:DNA repair protein RAD57 [Biscogniauxia mediterranea]
MTDLSRILPDFPIAQYAHLLPAIEKHHLSTTDLLTLDVTDIGKRTQLPLLDIKRLCNAVLRALHVDLGVLEAQDDVKRPPPRDPAKDSSGPRPGTRPSALRHTGAELIAKPWCAISTLDASLDAALGGGVPARYVTEIVGESGAGKTQFLLTLLLSVQLPPPHGLGRPALYISTEAPLSTRRLSQILANHPFFQDESGSKPSLDGIVSTVTPDLESQDHILTYQVPVEVERRNIGLIVLDSVAANYRAEFERSAKGGGSSGSNMAARSNELVRLGQLLRDLARKHDLAVVVANQVADRFSPPHAHLNTPAFFPQSSATQPHKPYYLHLGASSQESPLASRSRNAVPNLLLSQPEPPTPTPTSSNSNNMADIVVKSSMPEPPPPPDDDPLFAPHSHPALLLDHQQRWFTGWGDDPYESGALKTPSLGLVWSTQIASRVALFRRPVYNNNNNHRPEPRDGEEEEEDDGGGYGMASARATTTTTTATASWRRWMKVVFAPHVPGSGSGLDGAVEFEVTMGGIKGVDRTAKGKGKQKG